MMIYMPVSMVLNKDKKTSKTIGGVGMRVHMHNHVESIGSETIQKIIMTF